MQFTQTQLNELDPLAVLRTLGGYYKCPKDDAGNRLGPLVCYAGRYQAPDGSNKQFVGDEYANFAFAEQFPYILDAWASRIQGLLVCSGASVGLAMPMGGIHFNTSVCRTMGWRAIYPDKEVTAVKTATDRERSRLMMGRHKINPGDTVVVVEDVCNNFSTTLQALSLVRSQGGRTVAIVCLLNRSGKEFFVAPNGIGFPVLALVNRVIAEYRQEDPFVAVDVDRGNLVRKVKDEWSRLEAAMETAGEANA